MLREQTGWRPSLAFLACLIAGPSIALAQPASNPAAVDPISAQYEAGIALERAGKWPEAIRHYESAVRQYPEQQAFKDRLTISRMHFDVRRRYQDTSFLRSVDTMSSPQVLDMYDEILKNLERNYVDSPAWTEVMRHGTASLEVALIEPSFVQRHLPNVPADKIEAFRQTVRFYVQDRPQGTRFDLRANASFVAGVAKQQLGLSPAATVWEYVCGAVATLDPYSRFLTGNQLDETFANIEGNFVGLGVELKAESDRLRIVSVIAGGPAEQAGLKAGDAIVAVEDNWTNKVTPDYAADLLRGSEGTYVSVVVDSIGQAQRTMRVQRRRVEVPSVENVHIQDKTDGIGYLRLTSFQKTTIRDIDQALWQLHREGMQTLILDLRGNPGGLLTAGVDLADRFLSDGRIVQTRGRNSNENFDYVAHRSGTWSVPLVVLVDEDSASASEIFAAAIYDHGRGTIVGSRTYGKGTVQGIFRMKSAHAGLCLTTAKFYSPNGRPISGSGVTPHIPVEEQTIAMRPVVDQQGVARQPAQNDMVLETAVEFVRGNARVSLRPQP
ncbi:S41 family peptidase [Rosistilla oblonga]|uniref:S41 family peptidase n=1 Tax=Rosistilla oblonga TaxID=2527990 RepID=UPI003A9832E2